MTAKEETLGRPDLETLQDFRNDLLNLADWRRRRTETNFHQMAGRRRALLEQKNLHLIEADLHEAYLNIEQRRTRVAILAWAAEVDQRADPATRDMSFRSFPSSQLTHPREPEKRTADPPRFQAEPVHSRLAKTRTQPQRGPLQQLDTRLYPGFFA
jgi:hypothetical protein